MIIFSFYAPENCKNIHYLAQDLAVPSCKAFPMLSLSCCMSASLGAEGASPTEGYTEHECECMRSPAAPLSISKKNIYLRKVAATHIKLQCVTMGYNMQQIYICVYIYI